MPTILLSVLNIRNNSFRGNIPQLCTSDGTSSLKMVDLSYNQLEGPIPRSMENCLMLEYLNLGDNQLYDAFPSWLGTLPNLRLLILRSNRLHGVISNPDSSSMFPNLRVVDLSYNNFTGELPSEYFRSWNAMKVFDSSNSYLKAESSFEAVQRTWTLEYTYSTTITIKGTQVQYGKIQEVLVVIDLSSNGFQGEIPDSIGSLQGVRERFLNSSWNSHSSPSSTVSRNGYQLNTFENNSYMGNSGLCGDPLTKKCDGSESSKEPASVSFEGEKDLESPFRGFKWMTAFVGYGIGVVVGVVIENTVKRKPQIGVERIDYKFDVHSLNSE
ncbi:LRR domain containing protein [Parasponia andersonii]|uniref:LRR domain containing protein n=1 Tax=Parasponia andersonii TaxID=3476 RepID=A0A2P5E5A7_PARAD|nr:LRR domain containing protein [Parasponia andersonii]